MSKILLIVCIVTLCPLIAWSQQLHTARVKGRIIEKDTQLPLADASITLLYAKDSTRAAFTFAGRQGAFEIKGINPGAYLLYVTYLGYKTLLKPVQILPADTLTDLGGLALEKTGVNLQLIEIVEAPVPMTMKKDTLEFNADYYKTRENALMEALLKKLPGVQVDPDGTIRINGVVVKKILVDGRPFWGNNLKLAIQNLPADMINRIQFIDRKSEQAQFTGIDDGEREKTINITIKQSRKQQFFGRVASGYGTEGRFAGTGNLNRFSDGEQLSFIGNANNVNNPTFLDGGAAPRSNGLSRTWNAGANYSKDIGKQWRLNGSYTANGNNTENLVSSARQNILPDTTWYYNQHSRALDNTHNHAVNTHIEFIPDSMNLFTLDGDYRYNSSNSDQQRTYTSLGGAQQLINYGSLHNTAVNTAPSFGVMGNFSRRFRKPGHAFSARVIVANNNSRNEEFNRSDNFFILPGGDTQADTINQHNNRNSRQQILQGLFMYTVPVFKHYYLQLMYMPSRRYNTAEKYSYDFNPAKNSYDRFNDSLSNSFESSSVSHYGNVNIQLQREKYDFSIGLATYLYNLHNEVSGQPALRLHAQQLYPKLFFTYTFSSHNRLNMNYTGTPELPELAQLQPVPDNSNPLYIQLGNPDLRPALMHNASISYEALNPVSMRSFSVNINTSVISNKIINASWLDSLGRQVSQPLNMNGNYSTTINMMNSFPLKKLRTAINTNTIFSYNRDAGYVNGLKSYTGNFGVEQTLGFNYSYATLFELGLNTSARYNTVRYSLQNASNTHYFSYALSFNGSLQLPLGFSVYAAANYWLNTGLAAGYNQHITLLNGYIAKSMAHNRALLKFHVSDLLNRNVSIERTVGQSYVEDVRSNVLQRFFMCSFTYFIKEKKK